MQHKQNNALRICSTEQSSLQAHLALQQKCNTWRTMHCAFAVAQRIRFCRINAYMQKCNYSCLRKCALPDGRCIWVQCETACFGTCYLLLRVWHPQAHMLSISSQCVCVLSFSRRTVFVVRRAFRVPSFVLATFSFFIATGGFLFVLDAFDVKVMHTNID